MEGSIGYWHAMYAQGYINESRPRGRILREYETLMDRCVFADGNEWPVAACRFILGERFCHVEGTPRNHYDGNILIIFSVKNVSVIARPLSRHCSIRREINVINMEQK